MSNESELENDLKVFVNDTGKRVKFFLHESLDHGMQAVLEDDITSNGGVMVDDPDEADTVIVHHEYFQIVARRYDHSKTTWVERPEFVRVCLSRRMYYHDKPIKKSLGGRVPGAPRQEFSVSDDVYLAEYLANRIPDLESRGRTGYGVYNDLCDPVNAERYPWANRHPVNSWRNRYRHNRERIDRMIEEYLLSNPPHPQGKGEYRHDIRLKGITRRPAGGHRYIRRTGKEDEETDEEEEQRRDLAQLASQDVETIAIRTRGQTARAADQKGKGKWVEKNQINESQLSSVEQARRGDRLSSLDKDARPNRVQELPDDGLYTLDNQGDDNFPDFEDILASPGLQQGPSNTQATLVATQARTKLATAEASAATPSSSLLISPPRKAARNPERSATARPGATGKTILAVSPPKNTQATLVATQEFAHPVSQTRSVTVQVRSEGVVEVPSTNVSKNAPNLTGTRGQPNLVRDSNADANTAVVNDSAPGRRVKRGADSKPPLSAVPAEEPSTSTMKSANAAAPRVDTQSRKRILAGTSDAPYLNTRARSRSVEPKPMPPPPPPTIRRRGKAAMKTLEEIDEEPEHVEHGTIKGKEATPDEEQSLNMVENMVEPTGNTLEEDVVVIKTEEDLEEEEEEGDEDEDSQQSRQTFFRDRAVDIQKRNLNTIESTPRRTLSPQPSTSSRHLDLSSVKSRANTRIRRAESSEGEFPTPGTRAEGAKVLTQERERRAPFAPTPGTRAEKVASHFPRAKKIARR